MSSLPPDRGELPEAVRAQLDDAARAEPPTDLLGAVMDDIGRTRQAARWWMTPRWVLAVATTGVAVAAVVVGLLFMDGALVGGPKPVTAEAERDGFVLELTVAKETYAANEPIDVHATVTYHGGQPLTRIAGPTSVVMFSVQQVDGDLSVEGGTDMPCVEYPMSPNTPVTYPFQKSGGWSADDPRAAFFEAYFKDPLLRLPVGTWEVTARTMFDPGNVCTAKPIEMTASVRVNVEGRAPATASPTPSPPVTSCGLLAASECSMATEAIRERLSATGEQPVRLDLDTGPVCIAPMLGSDAGARLCPPGMHGAKWIAHGIVTFSSRQAIFNVWALGSGMGVALLDTGASPSPSVAP